MQNQSEHQNRTWRNWAAGLAVALLMQGIHVANADAKPLHYEIDGPGSKVSFNSDAPVEVITGHTTKVKGDVRLDDSFLFDAKHPFSARFAVDLTSIDTGIALRNEHMRDNFLETAKYPEAVYQVSGLRLVGPRPNLKKPGTVRLISTGNFSVHGVTIPKTIPLTVRYTPVNGKSRATIRIQGKFPVTLTQHHIQRPEAVFVKLAETVFVTVNLLGTSEK